MFDSTVTELIPGTVLRHFTSLSTSSNQNYLKMNHFFSSAMGKHVAYRRIVPTLKKKQVPSGSILFESLAKLWLSFQALAKQSVSAIAKPYQ